MTADEIASKFASQVPLVDEGEPVFNEPWQAQVFALTIGLYDGGHFGWQEWSEALGKTRAAQARTGEDDYYLAWLDTLSDLVVEKGLAEPEQLRFLRDQWREAYLRTPHGQPVELDEA